MVIDIIANYNELPDGASLSLLFKFAASSKNQLTLPLYIRRLQRNDKYSALDRLGCL